LSQSQQITRAEHHCRHYATREKRLIPAQNDAA
jgi:hypothetical protein